MHFSTDADTVTFCKLLSAKNIACIFTSEPPPRYAERKPMSEAIVAVGDACPTGSDRYEAPCSPVTQLQTPPLNVGSGARLNQPKARKLAKFDADAPESRQGLAFGRRLKGILHRVLDVTFGMFFQLGT